jgi:hypothetical protein
MIEKSSLPHILCQFYTHLQPASVPIKRQYLASSSYVTRVNTLRSIFADASNHETITAGSAY